MIRLLAEKIIKFFNNGIVLEKDVLRYIDSTFSFPDTFALEKIFTQDIDCETESLYDLIFSPNIEIQKSIEHILEKKNFTESDKQKTADIIIASVPSFYIIFKDAPIILRNIEKNRLLLSFLSKLKITKTIEKGIIDSIDSYVAYDMKSYTKVKIRNMRLDLDSSRTAFFKKIFQKLGTDDKFKSLLDFIIEFIDEPCLEADSLEDIWDSLLIRRNFYAQAFKSAEVLSSQLLKSNVETLISQGLKIPFIDKNLTLSKIEIIDTIEAALSNI